MQNLPFGHLILGSIGGTRYPVAGQDDLRNVLTVLTVRDLSMALRTVIPRS
jgi:hypothetical protein